MTEQELIEKIARAIRAKNWGWDDWHLISDEAKELYRNEASASISAIPITLPVLLGLINGEMVAVPVEATQAMLDALWCECPADDYRAMIEARPRHD